MAVLDRFFHSEDQKVVAGRVRQVVGLYSNNCVGIGLGGVRIGCLRRVVVLKRWLFEQV